MEYMQYQYYLIAFYHFPLYEPVFDFIQETDLILDEYFRNEISIVGIFSCFIMEFHSAHVHDFLINILRNLLIYNYKN